ncbi:hypothetical protein HF521_019015 [Silurus meridionalis]|uniref:Uncharacterized protein n=1 Tax=Silurus meridionalis TaxID=175797 RepID=A0A8T0BF38_SILME|nr:hypothetical protein HF521_019015 [Silurus meridionalis]
MQDNHACRVSIFKVLMFVIFKGVHVALADTVMVLKVGSSLDLPFNNPIESGLSVQWKFNRNTFFEYRTDQNFTFLESQFSERLKENYNPVGVTYTTQIFKVYVQSPITSVQIKKSQTWPVSTNSCDIDVKCAALGAENVFYFWSGYKTARGAQLQFSLSPAEGAVTLNCTAANNVSSSSSSETLSCEQTRTRASVSVLKLISTLIAAFPYLLVTVILSVKCYRAHGNNNDQCAMAVIEE